MIIKKPYAFLIKHFKIIHLILFGFISYVAIKFLNIYSEFNLFVRSNMNPLHVVKLKTISYTLYLSIILIILFAGLMFLLMRNKNKPLLYYGLLFVYYSVLFIAVIYASNILKNISLNLGTQKTARAVRDIYLIFLLPNMYFLPVTFVRGLGFDIKQFDFSKDLLELDIDSKDAEEFEFVLGTDVYKYRRKFNFYVREFKYYYLENKYLINIVLLIAGGSLLVLIFINNLFITRTYREKSNVTANNLTYKVIQTHLTNKDYKDNVINENNKYILVNLNVQKKTPENKKMDEEDIYLTIGKDRYYNKPSLRYRFSDLSSGYKNDNLSKENDFLLIFEIPENKWIRKPKLNILTSMKYKNNKPNFKYSYIKLKPKKFKENISIQSDDEVLFTNSFNNNFHLTTLKYNIIGKYEYKYESCYTRNEIKECNNYTDYITPNDQISNHFVHIKYNLTLSDNSLSLSSNSKGELFNKIVSITDRKTNEPIKSTSHATEDNSLLYEIDRKYNKNDIMIKINLRDEIIFLK